MKKKKKENRELSISEAQRGYIEQEQFHKRKVAVCRIMLLVLLLAIWELCTRLGWIDDFIFSSPSRVFFCFRDMVTDRSIFIHIGITLFETLVSFGLVVVLGLLAAVLLWSSRSASEILEPYLVMLNSLPKSALAPVLIVWLGNHMRTIVVAAVSVAVFGSILTLHNGFSNMDPDKIKLIYSLGGSRKDVLTKVLLPGSVPLIVSNMKVNVGLCLVGVIIGEFLAAQQGLGYLIIYGSQVFSCVLLWRGLGMVDEWRSRGL
ncbi:MAG: ABC transporter permease [Lachnospiraceae bacterium]|nr:ABC transporter permease [Lachnospiraceae bacterium]